jgi:type IV pilus assembly protein PilP
MIRNQLKNSRSFSAAVFVIAGILAFTSGCKKKDQVQVPAPQPPPAAAQQAVQKPASSAARAAQTVSQFDFSTKKDPFKPFVDAKKPSALTAEEKKKALRNSLPIHSFDVSQFKLIGVVTDTRQNQAMVVDPSGKGYVLKVGMTIGKNEGRVTAINTGGVDILEQFKDESGRVRKENIKITLPRKQ